MKKIKFDISSAGLHILAMSLMLCDHLWATVIPGNNWLTCIGRLAFPIFAFMLVEAEKDKQQKAQTFPFCCPGFIRFYNI